MSKPPPPEAEFFTLVLTGDRRAQARLYERFAPYSLAVINRYGVPETMVADLLQTIFIEVFSNLEGYDPEKGKFTTWFRQITVFRIIDFQRKREHLKFLSLDAVEVYEPVAEVPFERLPPDYLSRRIAELPSGYRTVFNLFAVEGLPHTKIAELLGISPATSRSQYYRARKLLQASCYDYARKRISCYE